MAANLIIDDNYEPKISMTPEGISIVAYGDGDNDLIKKVEKKNLSASAVTGLLECPAKFFFSSFIERDVFDDSGSMAAKQGSLFHKVMEDFFALPPELRTTKRIKELADSTLMSDEFKSMANDVEVIAWLRDAINGYYSMGSKPDKVIVAEFEDEGKKKAGLEVFVKGRIGNATRDTLGFIDRLSVDKKANDGSVIVEDWKTGAKAKRWKIGQKDTMGLGEARQQVIYSLLLKEKGIKVSGARLIFPVARDIVSIDIHDEAMIEKTISDVEEADNVFDKSLESNTFGYGPSFLCAWCPLVKMCPAAKVGQFKTGKPLAAFESQPDVEDLSKVIAK